MGQLHQAASQTTSTVWPASHRPALYVAMANEIVPLLDTRRVVTGPAGVDRRRRVHVDRTGLGVGQPEPRKRWHPADRLMRPVMVVGGHPCVELAWASARSVKTLPVRNSARRVLCHRWTFPVVAGARGAVSRCWIPCSAQIRSNRTGPGPGPNRAVNTLPLSVKIASGTP